MAGIDGFGTIMARGDGAAPTEGFTPIANVGNISGPGLTRETIDVTAHDSPNQYTEHKGGLKDGGEVSFDLNYNPPVHDILINDFDDENPRNWRIIFPDPGTTTWTFAAILTGFEPSAPYDDKLTASLTFKVSGKPTIA